MSTLGTNTRREFIKRFSVVCLSVATAPALVQAAGATNSSSAGSATSAVERTAFTRFSIMPGKVNDKATIEQTLKSITGVKEVGYNDHYRYASINYQTSQSNLPAIIQTARNKGLNIQRLRCDKRAPYCDRQCQVCPAKRHDF